MSKVKEYRIKLNLSHVFNDYRQYCYTIIKNRYEKVADLMQHIQNTYEVHDFYLAITKKKNFYLCPHEDIRIIRPNNTIIVIPNNSQKVDSIIDKDSKSCNLGFPQVVNIIQKRKRSEELLKEQENVSNSVPNKKTKKNKVKENEIANDMDAACSTSKTYETVENNNSEELSTSKKKNKKKKKTLENGKKSEYISNNSVNTDKGKEYSNESFDSPSTSSPLNNIPSKSTNKQDSLKKLITHFTPIRNIQPSSTITKKINVIKNIIINKSSHDESANMLPSTSSCNNSTANQYICNSTTLSTTNMNGSLNLNVSEPKQDQEDITFTSPSRGNVTTSSLEGKFVTQRKGKRVNKEVIKSHLDSPMPVKLPFQKKIGNGKPLIHKQIDDILEVPETTNGNTDATNNTSMNLDNDIDRSEIEQTDSISDQNNLLMGEFINPEKYLLMTNITPKVNDFILFQKLKLTDDYTPVISKYIIGQVLQYNENSQEIDIQVTLGIKEFDEPQGCLSVYEDDGNFANQPNPLQTLSWNTLIQPRLLPPLNHV